MTDNLTLTGLIATQPKHIMTTEGLAITSFRLASTQRRFDRAQDKWVDGDTNWYTITMFRQLAMNGSMSLTKGERVIVTGRLRIREWDNGEKHGLNVDIEADAVGHDLTWGTSTYTRSVTSRPTPAEGETFPESVAGLDPAPEHELVDALLPETEPALPF